MSEKYYTTIAIDPAEKTVHLYSMPSGDKEHIIHDVRNYKTRDFDEEFYGVYTDILRELGKKYSNALASDTTLVLPDRAIFTDAMTLPILRGKSMNSTVDANLSGMYKNLKDLRICTNDYKQNKRYSSCCLYGVQKEILMSMQTAGVNSKILAKNVTFSASATATAVATLNPKLKNATYLLLDIKEKGTRAVYVLKGRAVGFGWLPFGFDMLDKGRLASEDMLFDHSVAELAVLNAREKARSKALTMMGGEESTEGEGAENAEGGEQQMANSDFAPEAVAASRVTVVKTLPKKTPRKLPKFMLRPVPETPDDMNFENFRIFEKWALDYLAGNTALTSIAKPEAVYVNLPARYESVFAKVNEEEEENGIRFRPAGLSGEPSIITEHLDLYGGLFSAHNPTSDLF